MKRLVLMLAFLATVLMGANGQGCGKGCGFGPDLDDHDTIIAGSDPTLGGEEGK